MLRRSKSDAAASQPTRVLVVNDDRDACELIARIFESAGWTAARATSDDEALGLLSSAEGHFTAAVLDHTSGGTSADLQLLEAIRRQRGSTELPVVILARSDKSRMFAWESGVDGFLVRPFHADDLVNALYAIFTRSGDEREAYRLEQLADA